VIQRVLTRRVWIVRGFTSTRTSLLHSNAHFYKYTYKKEQHLCLVSDCVSNPYSFSSRIDSYSPPHKRQRMSSPTYDEQLALPSQEELSVMDNLELTLSHAPSLNRKGANNVHTTGLSSPDSYSTRVRSAYSCLISPD
jgi:hypothetical protein